MYRIVRLVICLRRLALIRQAGIPSGLIESFISSRMRARSLKERMAASRRQFAWIFLYLGILQACTTAPAVSERAVAPAIQSTQQLDRAFYGIYSPYSRSFLTLGKLVITPASISWGTCIDIPYSVIYREGESALLEFDPLKGCLENITGNYLVLERSKLDMTASICQDRDQYLAPRLERNCAWGILNKEDPGSDATR